MRLKKGSRGNNVKLIQQFLNLTPDGIFGNNTRKAVLVYQKQQGLSTTGMVTDNIWWVMFGVVKGIHRIYDTDPTNKLGYGRVCALVNRIPIDDSLQNDLMETIEVFNIDTVLKLVHFVSQCHHESNGFRYRIENLNYSNNALLRVFSKYFRGRDIKLYARKPKAIASLVYANRMGNGNEESTDGWKYRGRGFIQQTGHRNYKAFGDYLGINLLLKPYLVATEYPFLSAGFFFNSNNLFALCNRKDQATITKLTKRINGGTHGLKDRIRLFDHYYGLLVD